VILLSVLAGLFRHFENNHRSFILNTRIHIIQPRTYDAHFKGDSLVLVRSFPVRDLVKGDLISIVTNRERPWEFSNEIFVEFQEEFYGLSLHGIVTERTQEREQLPLRASHYIGVPYGSIPLLGSILIWIVNNLAIFSVLAVSSTMLAILVRIAIRKR